MLPCVGRTRGIARHQQRGWPAHGPDLGATAASNMAGGSCSACQVGCMDSCMAVNLVLVLAITGQKLSPLMQMRPTSTELFAIRVWEGETRGDPPIPNSRSCGWVQCHENAYYSWNNRCRILLSRIGCRTFVSWVSDQSHRCQAD